MLEFITILLVSPFVTLLELLIISYLIDLFGGGR